MATRSEQTARARRTWEKSAPDYDSKISFFERTQLAGSREWLGTRARGRVLEVAIGTGRNLPLYPDDTILTGLDLSPAMLAIAMQRAADLGREVDLHEGDAEKLPFSDGTFDSVVCAISLCNIPDPVAAINEMSRVLAPGGHLLLVDHIRSSWPPIYLGQWLLERITIPVAGEHFTRRPLPLVKAAGFEIVESERIKVGSIERVHARKPTTN